MKNRMKYSKPGSEELRERFIARLASELPLLPMDANCRSHNEEQKLRPSVRSFAERTAPSAISGRACRSHPQFTRQKSSLLLFQKGAYMDHLTKSRLGRVILHALCLLRRPSQAHWHWLGIVRELAPKPE